MAGAADILPAPAREASLALSLERLLAGRKSVNAPAGKVIGIIKAGGGVGATAVGTQLALILAARRQGVCFADLDVQFGQAALKFDVDDAMTLTDILGGDGAVDEAPLASVLATHDSGVRLLAAPRDMTPLEAVSPQQMVNLIKSLRREFGFTLLDLPSAWTAWTNQALQLCDHIILMTNLTVSHIQLTRRQLKTMASQGLDVLPLALVCNKVGDDQQNLVSVSAAEKAMGRKFNFVIPEDRKLMNAAIAQGCALSMVRAGSKLEKAIERLADDLDPDSMPKDVKPKRRWL
jgi:pilus assembly protein CpaE